MRLGLAVMFVLAVLVGLYSLRYVGVLDGIWLSVDRDIRGLIVAHPVEALTHMLVAPVALLLGPFQLMSGLRQRHLAVHRWTGRLYALACIVAGTGGLATAFHASGGPVAGLGFGLLAVLWVATTLAAWMAAASTNIPLHRLLMRFSYAMTFGAVMLRLQIPLGLMVGYRSYATMSVWLAYTAWIPNVVAVALYSWRDGTLRHLTAGLRSAASGSSRRAAAKQGRG